VLERFKTITDFGIFIGFEEGVDGLVHVSEMSWTKKIKHPSELYKKGQEVEALVLNIDPRNERFSLGVKQLMPDPGRMWRAVPERRSGNREGNQCDRFGAFIELEEGMRDWFMSPRSAGKRWKNLRCAQGWGYSFRCRPAHRSHERGLVSA